MVAPVPWEEMVTEHACEGGAKLELKKSTI
jgi:hypothetical protein